MANGRASTEECGTETAAVADLIAAISIPLSRCLAVASFEVLFPSTRRSASPLSDEP